MLRDDAALRLKYRIPNESPGALTVLTRLFPYDPLHQTFINIYENGELKQQLIFNAGQQGVRLLRRHDAGRPGGDAHVHAVGHAPHPDRAGPHPVPDRPAAARRPLDGAARRSSSFFTIGHSITLSLAALNLVTPPPSLIEPAIALSIVFVGADNLVRGDGRDLRAWVALVFGLVHGFGFANVLREFGLPREALGWSLFSFNVGVEIGQLGIVLVVATLLDGDPAAERRRGRARRHRRIDRGDRGRQLLVRAAGVLSGVEADLQVR